MSQFYVENLKREIVAGQMQNAKQAKHSGGLPPFGYSLDKNLKYVINEEEAHAVRMLFQMAIDGYSYADIARRLNDLGYRTRQGNLFHGVFTDVLKNRKYVGEYVYNRIAKRKVNGKRNSHFHKPESEIVRIEGGVPAIIEQETFEKVQELLRLRRHRQQYSVKKSKYLLSGMIRCGVCGFAVSGWTNVYGKNRYTGFYYACSHKENGKRCGLNPIKMKDTDNFIHNFLFREILNLSKSSEFVSRMKNELFTFKNNINIKVLELEEKAQVLKGDVSESGKNLVDAKKIRRIVLIEHISSIEDELQDLEGEIKSIKSDLEHLPKILKKDIDERIRKYGFELKKVENDSKRNVLLEIIHQIKLDQNSLTLHINLKAFLETKLKNDWIASYEFNRSQINPKERNSKIVESTYNNC